MMSALGLDPDLYKVIMMTMMMVMATNCGFWSNRTLLYFPLSVRSSVRPFVRHRRDISTFLDILTVYTMKTIYFLNAYHLDW